MNKQTEILNLSKFIFNDKEFTRVEFLLKQKELNLLRLLVSEKLELLYIIQDSVETDDVLNLQIQYCNRLEDVVLDYYLEHVELQ